MNFIDIIVIIFIALLFLDGYKKGFIKTLFDTIGVIVAFFLSNKFNYIVENFLLSHTKLYIKVHDFFELKAKGFTQILQNGSEDITNAFSETMKLPVELQNVVSNMFNTSVSSNIDSFSLFVDKISVIVIRSLSFLITFLFIYIVLVLASNLINVLFKLPVLNLINRIFGATIGAIKAVIVLYIVFALCSPLIGFVKENTVINEILESESSKVFYDNNIILNYLSYKGFYDN